MKFIVLTEDRNCNNNCISEHGLSIYIETECYTKRYSLSRNLEYAGINETREELIKKLIIYMMIVFVYK